MSLISQILKHSKNSTLGCIPWLQIQNNPLFYCCIIILSRPYSSFPIQVSQMRLRVSVHQWLMGNLDPVISAPCCASLNESQSNYGWDQNAYVRCTHDLGIRNGIFNFMLKLPILVIVSPIWSAQSPDVFWICIMIESIHAHILLLEHTHKAEFCVCAQAVACVPCSLSEEYIVKEATGGKKADKQWCFHRSSIRSFPDPFRKRKRNHCMTERTCNILLKLTACFFSFLFTWSKELRMAAREDFECFGNACHSFDFESGKPGGEQLSRSEWVWSVYWLNVLHVYGTDGLLCFSCFTEDEQVSAV